MASLEAMAPYRFVSLTTFRRTGEGVPTPVWVVGDGQDLLVLTPAGTGKVKRVRRTPRVEVRPSSRRGRVHPEAPVAVGLAEVLTDDETVADVRRRLEGAYGAEYRIFMVIERLVRRGVEPARVVIRIRPGR